MALDINTPKGEVKRKCQYYIADVIAERYGMTFIHCPDASRADGFLSDSAGTIRYVVEIKCRGESYEQFLSYGSFMVSESKYDSLSTIGELLDVPFLFVVGMGSFGGVSPDFIGVFEVFSGAKLKHKLHKETKQTRKTINGGRKYDQVIHFDINNIRLI